MTQNELNKILENHKHWINRDCEDWKSMKADLRYANLRYADLRNANLRYADLRNANLRYADLRNAYLRDANLRNANLGDADLSGAILIGADLRNADLGDADLGGAYLRDVNISDANLRGAKNIPFIPMACPDTGAFIGYKKASGYILKIEILQDARRSSSNSRKCRCDKAKVLEIQNLYGDIANVKEVKSDYDKSFIYRLGEIVEEPNFCEDRWNECAEGIHFFINRQEAVEYGH
jgi:uncharacterized protein YjbI with pentapeptide repeats